MKKCTVCKIEKHLSEFYMIGCWKWKKKYPHVRCKDCEKVIKRKYYIKNKEKLCEYTKKYRLADPERAKRIAEKVYANSDKRKVKARAILNCKIRYGKIIKPENCEVCKEKQKLQAHHDDYDKPLEVKWLCRRCHDLLHRKLKYDTTCTTIYLDLRVDHSEGT